MKFNFDENCYFDGELGAIYSKKSTCFRVWTPTADNVKLKIYKDNSFAIYDMVKVENAVWEASLDGDFDGALYNFIIEHDGKCDEVVDIYAKACNANGEIGAVVNLAKTDPENFENSDYVTLEKQTDAVIYELHVRDFSSDVNAGFKNKGKFAAFLEENLTNSYGEKIGFAHIKELGVTHVHLLPIYDYATVDELNPDEKYNWGYDPLNFNVPEGSYSSNPNSAKARILELKQLIQKCHENGIGVVMDVVYNHTYDLGSSGFNRTVPAYFYRSFGLEFSNASACGNEVATERKMVRKFIVDSVCYWAKEYKIDGFRFDLMGIYDCETVNKICEKIREINPNALLYGEGWTGGDSPLATEKRALKDNARAVPKMAMFSDNFRDSVKGDVFINELKGFVNGKPNIEKDVMSAMIGGVSHPQLDNAENTWTDDCNQVVNYAEAHDNLTLWDKLFYTTKGHSKAEKIAMDKLSAAMIFLSLGIPFIQAGQEFLRSKPLDEENFVHDSYNSPDSINSIKWENKHLYNDVFEYYKGLISLRKMHSVFHISSGDEIRNAVRFLENTPSGIVGIVFDDRYFLYLNSSDECYNFELDGEFEVLVNDKIASANAIEVATGTASVAPISALLLRKKL